MITKSGDQHIVPDQAPAASWSERFARFSNVHSTLLLIAVALTIFLQSTIPLLIEATAVFGVVIFIYYRETRLGGGRFGVANTLTLGRLCILLLAALMLQQLDPAWIFLLFASNVVLDVVDGKLARQRQEHSAFGAEFDAEVDALFVLIAGLYFTLAAGFGLWVLIAGSLRYVYRLATWFSVGGEYIEPPQRSAKIMAGLVFVLLPAAVVLNSPWQVTALILTTVVSVLSFSISAYRLLQYRRDHPPV